MTGTLKENIRNDFSAGFHDNCIRLIGEACLDLKNKHIVTVDGMKRTYLQTFLQL